MWFATGSVGGGGGDGGMGRVAHLEIYYATYVHKQGHARDGMRTRKNAEPFGERCERMAISNNRNSLTSRCERQIAIT